MDGKLLKVAVAAGLGLLVLASPAETALAQVNINVNIGAPPPVIVHTPPTMLFLPEPGFYVAVGIPYNVFFVSGRYYYLHGSDWFWAPGYDGPWVYVGYRSLPPGLQKYKVAQLHSFRDREYHAYRVQGAGFTGRRFEAAAGPGGGNGRGNGRGRGNR